MSDASAALDSVVADAKAPSTSPSTSYDAVPYVSHSFPQSDPRRIFCIARMFGIAASLPGRARILEIGCAAGGNIIPLAARLPNAHCVGIDASERQIAEARQRVAAMGLPNIAFLHADVSKLDETFQPFDYIICHGVYSWVTPAVQAAILRVCRANLAPRGVAYVSYNVYPGWKNREILRDAMLFHTAHVADPRDKLAQGRGMVEFMRELANPNTTFGRILADEGQLVHTGADDYILHDHLEENNHPCYFHDFARRAAGAGLAYLGDTAVPGMFPENYGQPLHQRLLSASGGDQVALEQYLDFASNRTFRQSLLVRDDDAVAIDRALRGETLRGFAYRSMIVSRQDRTDGDGATTFHGRSGATITTNDPDDRAALSILAKPGGGAISWNEWCAELVRLTRRRTAEVAPKLETLLIRLVVIGLVELFDAPIAGDKDRSTIPTADPVARRLAASGTQSVANRFHEAQLLSAAQQIVIPALDGATSEDRLRAQLTAAVSEGKLFFWRDGAAVTDPDAVDAMTGAILAGAIDQARRGGLLL